LNTRKAKEQTVTTSNVPLAPDDYKAEFPADFKLPDGAKISTEHPRFKAFQQFAHRNGLTQQAFSDGLAMEARSEIARQEALTRARAAEQPAKIPGYDKMSARQKFALADAQKRGRS
jgi:hypothetical protein